MNAALQIPQPGRSARRTGSAELREHPRSPVTGVPNGCALIRSEVTEELRDALREVAPGCDPAAVLRAVIKAGRPTP